MGKLAVRAGRTFGFGRTTTRERHAASLFWADLVGRPVRHLAGEAAPTRSPGLALPPPAPRNYPGALTRQDGIDVYQQNDIPPNNQIRGAGIAFVIHRSSIGANTDREFIARYAATRASGLIRGSYHYYLHVNNVGGHVQANRMVAAVQRLGPGDLPPSLDFEEAAVANGSQEPATAAAWRTELEAFLDTAETKLGRTPLIYTRRSAWQSHLHKADFLAADFAHFGNYPLWVLHYAVRFHAAVLTTTDAAGNPVNFNYNFNADRDPARGDFPAGAVGDRLFALAKREHRNQAWAEADRLYARRQAINPPANSIPVPWGGNWTLFQYLPFTPGVMRPHGFPNDFKVDFNVTRGGIHALRGLADLGRTAPHVVGNQPYVAYAEPDGVIHQLVHVSGAWVDEALPTRPPAAGDPGATAIGSEQVIVYRAAGGRVHALTRNAASADARWRSADITGGAIAFADPIVLTLQNTVHVFYWDESNACVHLSRVNGAWRTESIADRPNPGAASRLSGSGAAYLLQNAIHYVTRSRDAGHLFDFAAPFANAPIDLTATSHGPDGQTPAATYRPATYARTGQAPRIVFRALRGHIWQIERDTLNALDLSRAANAPTAAGSPTAVTTDAAHILYRGSDGVVHEIYDDRGAWRTRPLCAEGVAASDPTAYVDERGHAAVTFRTMQGPIRLARLVRGQWACENL